LAGEGNCFFEASARWQKERLTHPCPSLAEIFFTESLWPLPRQRNDKLLEIGGFEAQSSSGLRPGILL
jgi:hypothetical protein